MKKYTRTYTRTYGVFLEEDNIEKLIFSDNDETCAIYERKETAEAFKLKMESRWGNAVYEMKEVVMEVTTDD